MQRGSSQGQIGARRSNSPNSFADSAGAKRMSLFHGKVNLQNQGAVIGVADYVNNIMSEDGEVRGVDELKKAAKLNKRTSIVANRASGD